MVMLAGAVSASSGGIQLGVISFVTRIQTFTALQGDSSAIVRGLETRQALAEGIQEPLGAGLGVFGTSGKLSNQGTVQGLDSGYLSRFVEMGVVGFLLYVAALIVAFLTAFAAYRRYSDVGDRERAAIAAVAVSMQVALLVADIFADHHFFLAGLFFWLALSLTSTFVAPSGMRGTGEEPLLVGRRAPILSRQKRLAH